MGIVRMGPPEDLVLFLKEKFVIDRFVETGTYMGGTAEWASGRFARVDTIEGSEAILRQTSTRLAAKKNIVFHFGHSAEVLPRIVQDLSGPAIFWLDAHWSGGETYGQEDECPIFQEVDAVLASSFESFILIDDARLFLAPPPKPHKRSYWPDVSSLLGRLDTGNRYTIIHDDIIFSAPAMAKGVVAEFYQDKITREQRLDPGLEMLKAGLRLLAGRAVSVARERLRRRV